MSLSLKELIRLLRRREILSLRQEPELFLNHISSLLVRLVHLLGNVYITKLVITSHLKNCSNKGHNRNLPRLLNSHIFAFIPTAAC